MAAKGDYERKSMRKPKTRPASGIKEENGMKNGGTMSSTKARPFATATQKQTLTLWSRAAFVFTYIWSVPTTVFHYRRTWMKGSETAELLFKEPGGRNLCGCGRNTPPCFTGVLLQKGSRGPHNHCLITTSMRDECVLKGIGDRGQTQRGEESQWKQSIW